MSSTSPFLPLPPLANLERRGVLLRALRAFFEARGFLEVETPVRIPAPAQESCIDCPPSGGAWLRASPELQMKRLLAAGAARIYQIGPCFRAGERGRRHNPEFTMLEWYRAHAGGDDILTDCQALLREVVAAVTGSTAFVYRGRSLELGGAWEQLTVREAFLRWAGWDPVSDWDADRFDADLVGLVEPALPRDRPCVLRDYPAPAASLARLKSDDPAVAERWELYLGGLELANAYTELTEAGLQRRRFEAAAIERQAAGRAVYAFDEDFLGDLVAGRLPACAGIALGVDRLAMLCCDADAIEAVRPFCPAVGGLW
ncbi:MAG: EF-P lysine aminoacylase EpmA [Kiritimatiellae bacterium]|nr:EF-P lysine aminoacylase EpmA [Kiritimatiellia bacterium]